MLDKQEVQAQLDEIESQYSLGLVNEIEKLDAMIDAINAHTEAHMASYWAEWRENPQYSQYRLAGYLVRQLKRVEKFKDRLDLHLRIEAKSVQD